MCLHLNTWSTKLHKMCESLLLFVARLGITERTDNGEACNFLKIQLIDNETNHLFTITMTTWWDTGASSGDVTGLSSPRSKHPQGPGLCTDQLIQALPGGPTSCVLGPEFTDIYPPPAGSWLKWPGAPRPVTWNPPTQPILHNHHIIIGPQSRKYFFLIK